MASNLFSPKRGKLDRPAICKPSPPDPIFPIVPGTRYGSVVVSPYKGYCDDFLLQVRAWSLLAPQDAIVQVTAPNVDWATVTRLGTTVKNNNVARIAFKLTDVKNGIHHLPVTFTWFPLTPRQHSHTEPARVEQVCPSEIDVQLMPWFHDSDGWLTLYWMYGAWKPHAEETEYYDCTLIAYPGGAELVHYNRPSSPQIAPLLTFFPDTPETYECTARSYWPAGDAFETPTTETVETATVPGQLAFVHGYLTQPSAEDDTHLQFHVQASGALNAPATPVELNITVPGGSINWITNPISCQGGYTTAADWFNAPTGEHEFTIDAEFQNGYEKTWTGRLYRPVPASYP
jgi:hypothetical protein